MGKYLKMADVFNACDVVETDVKVLYAVTEEYDDGVTPHDYAHHAIQYHDELVLMNQELLGALEALDEIYSDTSRDYLTCAELQHHKAVRAGAQAIIAKAKGGAA